MNTHIRLGNEKAAEKYEANVRKKAKKAAARDHAEEILGTSLITSIPELDIQLRARAASKSSRISLLKDQFHARISGETTRSYPGIGLEYRSKHDKLKMTTKDTSQGDEQYLRALVEAMILEDGAQIGDHMPNFAEHFIRTLPSLSLEFTNPKSSELKAEFSQLIASLAALHPRTIPSMSRYMESTSVRSCTTWKHGLGENYFEWPPFNSSVATLRRDSPAGKQRVNRYFVTLQQDNFVCRKR
jgi:hypothetical protein